MFWGECHSGRFDSNISTTNTYVQVRIKYEKSTTEPSITIERDAEDETLPPVLLTLISRSPGSETLLGVLSIENELREDIVRVDNTARSLLRLSADSDARLDLVVQRVIVGESAQSNSSMQLEKDYLRAFESGDGADVKFAFEDGSSLRAHRLVLRFRAPILAALVERRDIVNVYGRSPDVMKHLLRYIYCGVLDCTFLQEHGHELIDAAMMYGLTGLKHAAEQILINSRAIDQINVGRYIHLAESTECELLLEYCFCFIKLLAADVNSAGNIYTDLAGSPALLKRMFQTLMAK